MQLMNKEIIHEAHKMYQERQEIQPQASKNAESPQQLPGVHKIQGMNTSPTSS